MEMEFKDNSRRRTLVLVVGVLLALGAGAAAFMLSSQGTDEPETVFPTKDVVVAAELINARDTIGMNQLTIRSVPIDDTNAAAFEDRTLVAGQIAAIPILINQPVTPNMLAQATGVGQVPILEPDATVAPDSPFLRAVSLTVPPERAVGGLIGADQRVDVIATMPFTVQVPIDPETGLPAADPETGDEVTYASGQSSTKLMWLDVPVISRPEGSPELYILRMDLQQAEEVALAQSIGASFALVLRPEIDTREVDRSSYGETQDRVMTRYNFAIPETVDALTYPQPVAFPTPFPNEPYVELAPEPSPTPESALVEIPVDGDVTESPNPDEVEPEARSTGPRSGPANLGASRSASASSTRSRIVSLVPRVSMRRWALTARRSARSGPCAASRRSMSEGSMPRPARRSRCVSMGHSMSQTSSQRAARPPSMSLMASTTANGSPSRRARSRRSSRSVRTPGWTMDSRSRRAPSSSNTMAPSATRSRTPAESKTPSPKRARMALSAG